MSDIAAVMYAERLGLRIPGDGAVPMESDPHGKSQHDPGAKLDAGKLRAALVLGGFANAL